MRLERRHGVLVAAGLAACLGAVQWAGAGAALLGRRGTWDAIDFMTL